MILGLSLDQPHILRQDMADAPPMHEGYALFLEEERYYTRLITITNSFIVAVIGAAYTKTGRLALLVFGIVIFWDFCFGLICCCFQMRLRNWTGTV